MVSGHTVNIPVYIWAFMCIVPHAQGRIFVVPASVVEKSEMLKILFNFDVERSKPLQADVVANTPADGVDHNPRKI